ncbi:hypothetical protein SRHO_G00192170 [Serrasalmus rhombeus]
MDPTTRLRCGGLWLAASTTWQGRSALSAAQQAGACSSSRSKPEEKDRENRGGGGGVAERPLQRGSSITEGFAGRSEGTPGE